MELRELRTTFNEVTRTGDVVAKFKKAVGPNGISLLRAEPGLLVKG